MNREVAQWHNRATCPNDFILVRLYESGVMTASRCVNGTYSPEWDLVGQDALTAVNA